jgi:tRNA A37 threonylcarbamoyladenosine synthetase subunit TsaC/SUA5/YrdC
MQISPGFLNSNSTHRGGIQQDLCRPPGRQRQAAAGPALRAARCDQNVGMAQYFEVHPQNPQARLLKQAAAILQASEVARFARVDNRQYRLLKLGTPGPYTFILEATKEVPRRLSHPSRRTIGLRVPEHKVLQELLALFGEPLLGTTLIPPGETDPLNDASEIRDRYEKLIGAVVDAGACAMAPTTVIDLSGDEAVLLRQGRGELSRLGL